MSGWKMFFIVLAAVFVAIVGSCVAFATCIGVAVSSIDTADDPLGAVEDLSDALANDRGREYMLSQPCTDVMAEYNAMKIAGHDAAVTHVANTYNIKTGTSPYIAISDASARVEQCQ